MELFLGLRIHDRPHQRGHFPGLQVHACWGSQCDGRARSGTQDGLTTANCLFVW
jgi:hypothetical protein